MDKLKEYIYDVVGIDVRINVADNTILKEIPIYLKGAFRWSQLVILDKVFLVAYVLDDEELSAAAIDRQLALIENKLRIPIILCLEQLEAYNRQRLVKAKRSFIVPGKQMYIPNLFLDFTEYNYIKKVNKAEHLQSFAQVLILFHLLNREESFGIEDIPFKEIAARFNVNTINVSRAVENLQQLELIEVGKRGRKKFLHFVMDRAQLWRHGLEREIFINPLHKQVYSNRENYVNHLLLAGETALAEYTNMNPTPQKTRALDQKDFDYLKWNTDLTFNEHEGQYIFQIWKYNPSFMNQITNHHDDKVDPLSLYLSFKDHVDERIEIELNHLIKKTIW